MKDLKTPPSPTLPHGVPVRCYPCPAVRFCQTLDLKSDPELIAAYRRLHSREGIWREILSGIKASGILEMEIYLLDTHLFMIVDLPEGLSWKDAMDAMARGPRQAEWEDFVSRYQKAETGARSEGKWRMMERIFHLYE